MSMKDENWKTKKYGRLAFISMAPKRGHHIFCLWKCDCGKEHLADRYNVLHGGAASCGCAQQEVNSKCKRWKGFGEISGRVWWTIRNGAEKRKIAFDITIQQAWDLFLKQGRKCNLTEELLEFPVRYTDRRTASLDRINSTLGYSLDNVQWVHRDINLMKGDLPQERFEYLCRKVSAKPISA